MVANRFHISLSLPSQFLVPELISCNGFFWFWTGSSSGIGQVIAVEYAKRGATVVIQGRNPQRIEETIKLCEEAGAEKSKVAHLCLQWRI